MKILKKDLKRGDIAVQIEDLDDLWYLSQLIEVSDHVSGKTVRKIKLKDKNEQNVRIFKKTIFIKLLVDKVEFHEYSDVLRVSGVVEQGTQEVPAGSHHTFNVEPGTRITVNKKWMKFQIDRLNESSKKWSNILLCVLDREQAFFALLQKRGHKILSELRGNVAKKVDGEITVSDFYQELIKKMGDYVSRYNISSVIVASPAFWKEELFKRIQDDKLKKKITLATCNTVKRPAIQEILARPEVKQVLKQQRITEETGLVEKLFAHISKGDLATYGLNQTEKALHKGAVSGLLLTTKYIHHARQENYFNKINNIMKLAESLGASVKIINSENTPGKKIDGLGGIAAFLRYKIY